MAPYSGPASSGAQVYSSGSRPHVRAGWCHQHSRPSRRPTRSGCCEIGRMRVAIFDRWHASHSRQRLRDDCAPACRRRDSWTSTGFFNVTNEPCSIQAVVRRPSGGVGPACRRCSTPIRLHACAARWAARILSPGHSIAAGSLIVAEAVQSRNVTKYSQAHADVDIVRAQPTGSPWVAIAILHPTAQ